MRLKGACVSNEFKFKFEVGRVSVPMVAEVAENENTPETLRGKAVELDVSTLSDWTEMPDCISLVKNTPPANAPLLPVPEGLTRCLVCNEFKGVMALKDVPDPQGFYQAEHPDTPLRVRCICDGVLCPCCKVNWFHKPTTNVWTERGGFEHVPEFRAWFPCDECNEKREAEADAIRRMKMEQRLASRRDSK